MIDRIRGALLLDQATFSEVENDAGANGQAAFIVIIASIMAAIGSASDPFTASIAAGRNPFSFGQGSALLAFVGIALWSIVAWLVWAAVTYFVGTKIFHGDATYGEMMRVTGFAYAPVAFMILGVIPCIGFALSLIVLVWALAAVIVGVREGLDLDFGRTLVTVILGWLVFGIGMGLIGALLALI